MKRVLFAVFAVTLLLTSCFKDDYNFDNLDLENYNPAVAAPIVNTRLTLHDLIEETISSDSSIISIDEDSLLWVTYSSKLFQMGMSDLFSIDDQVISESFTMTEFTISDLNEDVSVTMGDVVSSFAEPERSTILGADGSTAPFPPIPSQSGGEHSAGTFSEFSTVDFSSGTLTITVTNNWPIDITNLQIQILNSDDTPVGTVNYPSIPAGTSAADNIDLTGQTMDNAISANIVNIESPGAPFPSTVPINLADDIAINIATSGLTVTGGSAVFPSGDVVDETISVDMSLGSGESINSLRLSSGTINYDIDYGIREDANLTIGLPYATRGGVPFSEVIVINSDGMTSTNVTGSFDLSGYTMDLTAGGTATNSVEARILASIVSSGVAVPFLQTDAVDANLTLSGLEIEYLDGDLGVQTFNLAQDTVDFSFDQLDIEADITLADPRLTLNITNSFGMQLGANLGNLVAENDEESQRLTGLDSITIAAPSIASVGDSVTTAIEINNTTTNISDILSIKPNKLIFGMTGSTNPGPGPHTNFVTNESYVGVSMDVEIPLYGGVSGFVLTDTLDFPADAFNNVKEGFIRTQIKNEFPVGVDVQAYFVDEDYMVLDSLGVTPINVLEAAPVDADGDLAGEPRENQTDITLTDEMVENIKNAKFIILQSALSTTDGEAAKFYTSYGMDIKLAVFAKVRINLQEDNNEEE